MCFFLYTGEFLPFLRSISMKPVRREYIMLNTEFWVFISYLNIAFLFDVVLFTLKYRHLTFSFLSFAISFLLTFTTIKDSKGWSHSFYLVSAYCYHDQRFNDQSQLATASTRVELNSTAVHSAVMWDLLPYCCLRIKFLHLQVWFSNLCCRLLANYN